MAKSTLKNLDDGKLDETWDFLRRRDELQSLEDIEAIEQGLNAIDQIMKKRFSGSEDSEQEYFGSYRDIEESSSMIVVAAMGIMLSGGLDILRKHCEVSSNGKA